MTTPPSQVKTSTEDDIQGLAANCARFPTLLGKLESAVPFLTASHFWKSMRSEENWLERLNDDRFIPYTEREDIIVGNYRGDRIFLRPCPNLIPRHHGQGLDRVEILAAVSTNSSKNLEASLDELFSLIDEHRDTQGTRQVDCDVESDSELEDYETRPPLGLAIRFSDSHTIRGLVAGSLYSKSRPRGLKPVLLVQLDEQFKMGTKSQQSHTPMPLWVVTTNLNQRGNGYSCMNFWSTETRISMAKIYDDIPEDFEETALEHELEFKEVEMGDIEVMQLHSVNGQLCEHGPQVET